jgi:hypothetical protein
MGVGSWIARERGGATMQDGVVVSQHRTGMKENSHACIKGHYPSKGLLH